MTKARRDSHPQHSTGDAAETRERLLRSAKTLFAQKGLDGTTVKDLADHAGVNVSLISYYFQGKEGLYRACLEKFGTDRLTMAQRLLQVPHSHEELRLRVRMFCQEMMQLMASEHEETRIIMREIDNGLPVAADIFERTFLKNFYKMIEFLEGARNAGLLRPHVEPQIAAIMLQSCMVQLARSEAIGKRFLNMSLNDAALRERITEQFVSVLLDGMEARTEIPSSPRKNEV